MSDRKRRDTDDDPGTPDTTPARPKLPFSTPRLTAYGALHPMTAGGSSKRIGSKQVDVADSNGDTPDD